MFSLITSSIVQSVLSIKSKECVMDDLIEIRVKLKTILLHGMLFILAFCLWFIAINRMTTRSLEAEAILSTLETGMSREEILSRLLKIPRVYPQKKGLRNHPDPSVQDEDSIRLMWPWTYRPPGSVEITFSEDQIISIFFSNVEEERFWEVPDDPMQEFIDYIYINGGWPKIKFFPLFCLVEFFAAIPKALKRKKQKDVGIRSFAVPVIFLFGCLVFGGLSFLRYWQYWF